MNSDQYKRISDEHVSYKGRTTGNGSAICVETFVMVVKRRWAHPASSLFAAVVLTFVFVTTCSLAVLVKPPVASEIKALSVFTDSDNLSATSLWRGSMYTFAIQPK
jgi:hypothetical protein